MKKPTFCDLFSGAGGFSLGLERAGWVCIAHSEIKESANKILSKSWPQIPNLGSIQNITSLPKADLITAGSPCQDFSVAGNQQGILGKRSSLVLTMIDLYRQSNTDLLLWENVKGVLSSNKGADFAAIISRLVGEPIQPRKWGTVGVVLGRNNYIAWATLNTRFHGLPQNRERVFLIADKRKRNVWEIFTIQDMVLRNFGRTREFTTKIRNSTTRDDSGVGIARLLRSRWKERDYTPCITAHESKDYHFLVDRGDGAARKLTENEVEQLMGWPLDHTLHPQVPWMHRYDLVGNGVDSNLVELLGRGIKELL